MTDESGVRALNQHTPAPWAFDPKSHEIFHFDGDVMPLIASVNGEGTSPEQALADTRLIASSPDHALVCWAMCVQSATWEEWAPGAGEFCFAGLRYATKLDEFGAPILTAALRAAIAKATGK